MAQISVTCSKVIIEPEGRIRVRFGKREHEFTDLAHLKRFVADTLSLEILEAIALRIIIDRAPNNPTLAEGKIIMVDTSLNNWGTIT